MTYYLWFYAALLIVALLYSLSNVDASPVHYGPGTRANFAVLSFTLNAVVLGRAMGWW